jgi:hypothetical protein
MAWFAVRPRDPFHFFSFQHVLYGIDIETSSLTHLLAVRVGLLMTNS